MISHRNMLPVGQEGIFRVTKHGANVRSVLLGGIEIGIITNANWKMQFNQILRMKNGSRYISEVSLRSLRFCIEGICLHGHQ